jgi:hypothetical protein
MNKLNPSERASAEMSLRVGFALFVESLNLFSIILFYLCVEMGGKWQERFSNRPTKSLHGSVKTNPQRAPLLCFCVLN